MNSRKFLAFIGVSAVMFMLALGSGGCGSSGGGVQEGYNPDSGGNEGNGTLTFSGHRILMGASGRTDSEASELFPHIRNIITDSFDLSKLSQLNTDGLRVTSRDIIFLEDASTIRADDENAMLPIRYAFFNRHVTIAAIYPDAEDVKALGNILGVTLADPSSEPNSKYFEIVAASMRYASGDILPHTFIYIDKCGENRVHNNLYTVSYSASTVSTASTDLVGSDSPSDEELAERLKEYEANLDERLKERVQKVIDWSAGIDDTVNEFRETLVQMASDFAFTVADETGDSKKDLLQFVGGTYTTVNDSSYSDNFFGYDYARRNGSQADDWYNNFTDWLGCSGKDNYSTLVDHWNSFSPGLDLTVTHISYGLHSFEDHCDYYVISTAAGIHPHSQLAIRADHGNNTTGGEVKGSGSYHYAVVMGCNRDMSCYVWPEIDGINLVQMTPAATVNNDQSYSDTDGYSWTAGVTAGGGGGKSEKQGEYGEGHGEASFSYTVSHSSTKTFHTKDYNISVYNTHNDSGRPMAGWKVDVTPPSYTNGEGWTISEAARSAVTLNSESIWKVDSGATENASFKTQAHWSDGFYAAHDMSGGGRSHCDVHHDSGEVGVNIVKPVKIGLADPVTNGTSEGKTYFAKIYSEANWTASSNSDWLQLTKTSGGASNGGDFGYTAMTNTTNEDRIGTITITSDVDSDDQIVLTFQQSRY
ncbi:MAG: BACON domain-containing protein [Synergistaceae bacterium]|nr:BACON domain-containing protein [Synergistaceae bacterium]